MTELNGLVLCGGKSQRMGEDKASLSYHGVPEVERIASLLAEVCCEVFLSVATDFEGEFGGELGWPLLRDPEGGRGPMAGLRAAFALQVTHRGAAWLVLACDMPSFGMEALTQLVAAREPRFLATAFRALDGMAHPMAAIYEPGIRGDLTGASPRRVLQRLEEKGSVKLVEADDSAWLESVDTPEARAAWLRRSR